MKKRTIRTLQRINEEVAKKYKDTLFEEVNCYQTTLDFINHYTKPDEYKKLVGKEKEKIDELVLSRKAGMFDKKEKVVNEKVGKKFEQEISDKIDEYIKAGVLPDPKTDSDLQAYNKKIKKQWKKQQSKSPSLKKGLEKKQKEN